MVQAEDIKFLQELTEVEFNELVVIPLLMSMEYENIRYTHGILEQGKDVIFTKNDPIAGTKHFAATIKSKPLKGSVSDSKSIREVYYQVSQALKHPYLNPFDGQDTYINEVYVITPFPIGQNAVLSIKGELIDHSNRVNFVDGDMLISLIYKYAPSLLMDKDDPAKRYIHRVCQRFINSPSLGNIGETQKTIVEIYTGGYISPTTYENAKYLSFALNSEGNERLKLSKEIVKNKHIVVLADVGSGKTTLLQKLMLDIGGFTGIKSTFPIKFTPIFVPLSQICREDILSYEEFLSNINKYINQESSYSEFCVSNGGYILLLDGFDEIYTGHDKINEWIDKMASNIECQVVITSRPSRIPVLSDSFEYYQLLQLTDEEIRLFLRKVYPDNPGLQKEVYSKIMSYEALTTFCRTPLILTLYTILGFKYTADELPTRKTDIYDYIVKMLLGDWDKLRRVKNEFSSDVKEYILESIALDTQESRLKQFQYHQLLSLTSDIFNAHSIRSHPKSLFNELVYRSSLIRETDKKMAFEFVHLSFQEFFAAKRVMRQQRSELVQDYLFDEWWKNTNLFYFGLRRDISGVNYRINKRSQRNTIWLLEYLEEADYTDSKTKNIIHTAVGRHLLNSRPNENDLKIIAKLGDEVTIPLISLIDERRGYVDDSIIANQFLIFSTINSNLSRKQIISDKELMVSLSPDQMADIFQSQIQMVADVKSHQCLVATLETLRLNIRGSKKLFESLSSLKSAVRRCTKSSLLDTKVAVKMEERIEKIQKMIKK